MANPDWGTKHTCQNCGVKYYDLNRTPITCPQCGTAFNPDALLRSRRSKPAAVAKVATEVQAEPPAAKAAVDDKTEDADLVAADDTKGDDDLEDLAEDENEDEELIEDASELGEDDDDVAEVLVGDAEPEET